MDSTTKPLLSKKNTLRLKSHLLRYSIRKTFCKGSQIHCEVSSRHFKPFLIVEKQAAH